VEILAGKSAGKNFAAIGRQLPHITKSTKNFSARKANAILGLIGQPFWQDESYDHWARSAAELERIVRYIEQNPVAAGLVERAEEWRWSSAFRGLD
jgi:hypothetical protein